MKEINLLPFYVGQKVVAIKRRVHSTTKIVIKKNSIYVIKEIKQCKCGLWFVDIGMIAPYFGNTHCWKCEYLLQKLGNILYAPVELFAPIIENFQSISLEKVLEKETKLISVN